MIFNIKYGVKNIKVQKCGYFFFSELSASLIMGIIQCVVTGGFLHGKRGYILHKERDII